VAVIGAGMAAVVSLLLSPIALPALPPPLLVAYVTRLGIAPQQQERSFRGTVLPQVFADQLGWHDFSVQVMAAWHRIPASQRGQTGIKVDNYGEAASLDLYAGPQGLPPVLSGHNQYFLWVCAGRIPSICWSCKIMSSGCAPIAATLRFWVRPIRLTPWPRKTGR
jgi:hypothetical protein